MENKLIFVAFTDFNSSWSILQLYNSIKGVYDLNQFDFFIGCDSLACNSENIATIKSNSNINIKNIEITLADFNFGSFGHISKMAYARILMYDLFPELVENEHIVYLDVDTIVSKKIPEIYFDSRDYNFSVIDYDCSSQERSSFINFDSYLETNLKEFHNIYKKNYENSRMNNYFNSGVIIINNHKKMIDLFNIVKKSSLILSIDDQNLLNYYNEDHIKVLTNIELNYQPWKWGLEGIEGKVIISHFNGGIKPWNNNFSKLKNHKEFKFVKNYYEKISERKRILLLGKYSFFKNQIKISLAELTNNEFSLQFFDSDEVGIYSSNNKNDLKSNLSDLRQFDIVLLFDKLSNYINIEDLSSDDITNHFYIDLSITLEDQIDNSNSKIVNFTNSINLLHSKIIESFIPKEKIIKIGHPVFYEYKYIFSPKLINRLKIDNSDTLIDFKYILNVNNDLNNYKCESINKNVYDFYHIHNKNNPNLNPELIKTNEYLLFDELSYPEKIYNADELMINNIFDISLYSRYFLDKININYFLNCFNNSSEIIDILNIEDLTQINLDFFNRTDEDYFIKILRFLKTKLNMKEET